MRLLSADDDAAEVMTLQGREHALQLVQHLSDP
jgi:hypothetical protein